MLNFEDIEEIEKQIEKEKENKLTEIIQEQRKTLKRLSVLQQSIEYNRKLLETIVEHFPTQAANKDIKKLINVQMGAVRPLLDKVDFEGKDELLSVFDNLIGGKV